MAAPVRDFSPGDRVIVTDLRTGTFHPGVFVSDDGGDKCTIAYDSGHVISCGMGFVRKEAKA
jgi:hypothetical protein